MIANKFLDDETFMEFIESSNAEMGWELGVTDDSLLWKLHAPTSETETSRKFP